MEKWFYVGIYYWDFRFNYWDMDNKVIFKQKDVHRPKR